MTKQIYNLHPTKKKSSECIGSHKNKYLQFPSARVVQRIREYANKRSVTIVQSVTAFLSLHLSVGGDRP